MGLKGVEGEISSFAPQSAPISMGMGVSKGVLRETLARVQIPARKKKTHWQPKK